MTLPNSGAPGARCGIAATRFPPTALQTAALTVENNDSPLYFFLKYTLWLGTLIRDRTATFLWAGVCSSDVP